MRRHNLDCRQAGGFVDLFPRDRAGSQESVLPLRALAFVLL
jgi:hypothetical protein